ncbi:transcriptional regulator with XRE-family HTH domain [Kitasatospora sp. GP30]|uniref:helix-turn-helix domain-containing protein n=1 Tax=Kitasatospora sp. GP30 TaxID=3035084 RepID=UPI000C705BC4|nr:helix-turn-helix transcriptional regulator [Kitasatospora sp. GP30]MDH6138480.1 transcriptional regulator with XRE-family HTH domain [Kitasatospora sp. GP30]
MAARARELVPSGSALAKLGATLRELRTARGWSQAKLGVAVHSSADLVRRVEASERFPSFEFIEACDQALEADGALVDLWPAADEERRRTPSAGAVRRSEPPARFDPKASELVVADWVVSTGREAANTSELVSKLWVTEADVDVASGMLTMFRQLDHAHGAGQFAPQLRTYVETELSSLLSRSAASADVDRSRARIAAGFLELAGYQAVDAGRPGWAQSYYKQALDLTRRVADDAYGGYLVAVNLGHLALHCDQPQTALRWSQAASAGAGSSASPAVRAAITAVGARAHARLGDEREATAMLLQAESLLDTSTAEDEPPWIAYFNRAYLADEMAHCFLDLGRAPEARAQVTDALLGVGRDRVRRRAIDAALMASAWLRSGDIEQACAAGYEAAGYAARTSSGRCIDRIARLLANLAPHADQQAVVDLDEYVRHVLPAAAARRATAVPLRT